MRRPPLSRSSQFTGRHRHYRDNRILSIAILAAVVAFLIAVALASGQTTTYSGAIDSTGYHPQPGVTVQAVRRSDHSTVYKRLDPSVEQGSRPDWFECRYLECDRDVDVTRTTPACASEHGGGTLYPTVAELFRQAGVTHSPSTQDSCDFGFANSNGRALWGCAEYEAYTGNRNDPSCGAVEPTPTSRCTRPCVMEFGVCNCPSPTPTLPAPTPTPPVVNPTPCPEPTPCPTCPPVVRGERMPVSVRATINKALGSLGRQWQPSVAEARRWLDAHPLYVPSERSTGQLTTGWSCADGRPVATLEACQ